MYICIDSTGRGVMSQSYGSLNSTQLLNEPARVESIVNLNRALTEWLASNSRTT